MTEHTPTPWKTTPITVLVSAIIGRHDLDITTAEAADADFIVRACNAHEELVGAVKVLELTLSCIAPDYKVGSKSKEILDAALKKARGIIATVDPQYGKASAALSKAED